jgi:hypothetical protein
MSNQIPAVDGAAPNRFEAFAHAICQVRGWSSAAVERPDPERVRVTNTRAGQWVELCHCEGAEMASMTVGRAGQGAFFQPDWALPTTDFVTFRARQCAQSLRRWDRRARLRGLNVQMRLASRRITRTIERQRHEREAVAAH